MEAVEVKVGDRVANSKPGKAGLETHPVDRVIVTETDHDFVDLKVKPSRVRRAAGRVAAGLALAAAVVTGGRLPASAAPATLTTTYHHLFYDVTRGAFVEAVDLHAGDRLQTADGGEATVEEVTPYHSTEVTYDLTIDELHAYYVFAGDIPVLVHNCGDALSAAMALADRASSLSDRIRPAVAEAIESPDGHVIANTSQRGGASPELHEDVQSVLDDIPADARGGGHGRCGLAMCLSEALGNGLDPTGWKVAAVKIRASTGHPGHGEGIGPCLSCVPLVEQYNLDFVTGGRN